MFVGLQIADCITDTVWQEIFNFFFGMVCEVKQLKATGMGST